MPSRNAEHPPETGRDRSFEDKDKKRPAARRPVTPNVATTDRSVFLGKDPAAPRGRSGPASPRVAARRTTKPRGGGAVPSVSHAAGRAGVEVRSPAETGVGVLKGRRPSARAVTRPIASPSLSLGRPSSEHQANGRPDLNGTPTETTPGAVLVTGICGRLGRLLARKLHRTDRVVGVDRRPFPGRPKDIVHHELDLRRKTTRDLFRGGSIRAVVHLGVLHDPRASDKEHHSWNIVGFQKLLDYLAHYRVPKLVVLSSANVYGPQPDNPQFLTEDAPLLGAQSFRGIRDLVELDMLAQGFFWKNPETETVILRPCHILGRVHNAASNYLRLQRPMTVMGFDPMVQPVHERDVVDAVLKALRPGVRGIFNLRGPGEIPLSQVFAMLGRRPRAVPSMIARPILERLWTYRLTSFPAPEIDYLRFLCMVDDTRARGVLGYEPWYDLQRTVHSVEADR